MAITALALQYYVGRDVVQAVRPGLTALFITKTEGVQHLKLLDEVVSDFERARGMPVGGVGFGAMIEHPRALAHINDIAEHAPRVIAMMLGGEDFALETGEVVIARANHRVTYPARMQLIAAMNPCRCGHLGDPALACSRAPRCAREAAAADGR
mgnify:CR=1 FL=1